MRSTEMKARIFRLLIDNLLVTIVLYILVAGLFEFLGRGVDAEIDRKLIDTNIVRATYPNYAGFDPGLAESIFSEYASPETEYRSFTGYRRKEFDGEAVNILSSGFRNSTNHDIDGSVWFLGGSTMWGTGAHDSATIPSYYAEATEETVLNLGESGYNSFQELIQLQLLLAKGFKPSKVVFYDGVNDGYYFCQRDRMPQLRHGYTSRFYGQDENLRKARKKIENIPLIDFERVLARVGEFFLSPLRYFRKLSDSNAIESQLVRTTPFTDVIPKKPYLFCDEDSYATRAAEITIFSWQSAYELLQPHKIPVFFVLQPAAVFSPERYDLSYLIDAEKITIATERDSYEGYYWALKNLWAVSCHLREICHTFIDLSGALFELREPLFIDSSHVSPNGNLHIARRLATLIGPKTAL